MARWKAQSPVLLIAIAAWLVSLAVQQVPFWQALELREYDLLSAWIPPDIKDPPIIIVGIDEPTFAELDRQWPWPRGIHGDLIDALSNAGAAVIGLDIVFAELADADQDDRLAAAIARAGNVVLAADLVLQQTPQFSQLMRIEPAPLFRLSGGQSGIVALSLDPDLVVRRIPFYEDSFWSILAKNYTEAVAVKRPPPPREGDLIRFLDPVSGLRTVSYYQALDPDTFLPPDIFKGKIVLVGLAVKASPDPQAPRADQFATPLTAQTGMLAPGVAVHGTLVANALYTIAITPASPITTALFAAIFALLSAVLMDRWTPLSGTLWLTVGLVTIFAMGCLAFKFFLTWTPALHTGLVMVLVYLGHGGHAFVIERRRRRQIRGMFQRYVSADVVQQLIDDPKRLRLGGEARELTLMFTDIAGFTSLSEKLAPEELTGLMNDYLTRMSRIVMDNGGTVDKFIGDAIMAFWNAPLEDPDHARHAVQAALRMRDTLETMAEEARASGQPTISARIGIHTGAAIVGNMGSKDRFDYTALGDSVNLASRLEGINKLYGTTISLSGETAERLTGEIPLRRLDRVRVKGRQKPVQVFTPCDDRRLIDVTDTLLDAFQSGDMETAKKMLFEISRTFPEDLLCRLYQDRISQLENTVQIEDWDGTINLGKM